MSLAGSSSAVTVTAGVSSAAKTLVDFGFSAEQVAAADRCIICVTAGALRLTWDHPTPNAPTTSAGQRLPTNNYPLFVLLGRSNLEALSMIRDSTTDVTAVITLEQD